jgi:hypothetical protein
LGERCEFEGDPASDFSFYLGGLAGGVPVDDVQEFVGERAALLDGGELVV